MTTVREVYQFLDERRRELDALIFSIVGLDNECGGMESLDEDTRRKIEIALNSVLFAERFSIDEILGEERK